MRGLPWQFGLAWYRQEVQGLAIFTNRTGLWHHFKRRKQKPLPTLFSSSSWHVSADWKGDANSKHEALLQALGEVEPEEVDGAQTWSAAVLPVSRSLESAEGSFCNSRRHMSADWNGDTNSKHEALLQALGEVEPEEVDEAQTWSAAVLPVSRSLESAEGSFSNSRRHMSADWNGDANSKHEALLQALGEVEPEEVDEAQTWSAAVLPVSRSLESAEGSFCNSRRHMRADWNGDTNSKHEALLQALGEVEPEEVDEAQTWSAAVLPASRSLESAVGSFCNSRRHTSADWNGDANSKHEALLQALGEVEPEEVDEAQTWSAAVLPVSRSLESAEGSFCNSRRHMSADWNGDANSKHEALLQALGEVEPEEVDEAQTWSAAVLPASRSLESAEGSFCSSRRHMSADWNGDANSKHEALLQALGEVEPEEVDEAQTWSPAVLPVSRSLESAEGSFCNSRRHMRADWNGDTNSKHEALLQALGEVEPEEVDEAQTWSAAVLPVSRSLESAEGSFCNSRRHMSADWNGDANSKHEALLQALGEVEPEEVDEAQTWSAAVLPVSSSLKSADGSFRNSRRHMSADWNGDANSKHEAVLQALGEVEPEEVDEAQTWSAAVLPASRSLESAEGSFCNSRRHMSADWNGDAKSRHEALLQALGEVEPQEVDEAQTWSAAVLPVSRSLESAEG